MKLLTERSEKNPLGKISLEDLKVLVTDKNILSLVAGLQEDIKELKKCISKIDKAYIRKALLGDDLFKTNGINLTSIGSIEKNPKIPVGVMYYNAKSDCFRIKLKTGWTNL